MIDALEQERTRVQRIRIICIVAWGIVLLVPLFMGGLMAASIGPASTFHLFPMGGFMVFGPLLSGLGTIAFVVAVIATGALFFRSRSVSLASIDARLRYLEELLERRDSPRE